MAVPSNAMYARYEAALQSASDQQQLSNIPDFSGNNHKLFGVSTQQKYAANVINGKPAYYFAGSGYYQASSSDYSTLDFSTTTLSISVVMSSNNANTSRAWPFGLSKGDTASLFSFTDGAASGKYGIFLRGASNVGQVNFSDAPDTDWVVLTMVYDGSAIKVYRNGTEIYSVATSIVQAVQQIKLGSNTNQNWEGYIAAAFVWNKALGVAERSDLHTYVQDTYGITVSDYVPSNDNTIKVNTGGSWQSKPLKVWDGSAWENASLKRYDGSNWV